MSSKIEDTEHHAHTRRLVRALGGRAKKILMKIYKDGPKNFFFSIWPRGNKKIHAQLSSAWIFSCS